MKFSDKHTLIIEDQRPFLLLLRGLLNTLGAVNVVTKSSAELALSLCKKQKFDIIVCDLHLGSNKKNAFELIEELRIRKRIKPSTIFLIISADSTRPMVLGSIERRPDDFLIKPFSLAQLKTRLERAWHKRQHLLPVYKEIFNENWTEAVNACQQLVEKISPYQRACEQLLVELYWQTNQPEKALLLLKQYETGRPIFWAKIALAKTYLLIDEPEKSLRIIEPVVVKNRFSAEAYDILAQCNYKLNHNETALEAIKQAIKLSPYSIPRHYSACMIAKDNKDYEFASKSSQAIWDLSKNTVHKNTALWCTYIRSLLDVAEYTEDKGTKNRYQQEAILVTQRAKHDDTLFKIDESFDVGIYEYLVNARINAIDGKMVDAQQQLAQSIIALEQRYDTPPVAYLPDTIKTLYDVGEFEEAMRFQKIAGSINEELDPISQQMLAEQQTKMQETASQYQKFNRQGISLYQQGQFEQAKQAFTNAQAFAPVNTGIALNLLQCYIKLLNMQEKHEPTYITECKRLYRMIEDMPLKTQHQQKFDELKDDLFLFIGKKPAKKQS